MRASRYKLDAAARSPNQRAMGARLKPRRGCCTLVHRLYTYRRVTSVISLENSGSSSLPLPSLFLSRPKKRDPRIRADDVEAAAAERRRGIGHTLCVHRRLRSKAIAVRVQQKPAATARGGERWEGSCSCTTGAAGTEEKTNVERERVLEREREREREFKGGLHSL